MTCLRSCDVQVFHLGIAGVELGGNGVPPGSNNFPLRTATSQRLRLRDALASRPRSVRLPSRGQEMCPESKLVPHSLTRRAPRTMNRSVKIERGPSTFRKRNKRAVHTAPFHRGPLGRPPGVVLPNVSALSRDNPPGAFCSAQVNIWRRRPGAGGRGRGRGEDGGRGGPLSVFGVRNLNNVLIIRAFRCGNGRPLECERGGTAAASHSSGNPREGPLTGPSMWKRT